MNTFKNLGSTFRLRNITSLLIQYKRNHYASEYCSKREQVSLDKHIDIYRINTLDDIFNNRTIRELLKRKSIPLVIFKWATHYKVNWYTPWTTHTSFYSPIKWKRSHSPLSTDATLVMKVLRNTVKKEWSFCNKETESIEHPFDQLPKH